MAEFPRIRKTYSAMITEEQLKIIIAEWMTNAMMGDDSGVIWDPENITINVTYTATDGEYSATERTVNAVATHG